MHSGRPKRDPQTYAIIGAAMAVHRELGAGFLEGVYQEALGRALSGRRIPFQREVPFAIAFEGQLLSARYRADFVCYKEVLVELKAQAALSGGDLAQVINYLKASGLHRGLLINCGAPRLEYRRVVLSG